MKGSRKRKQLSAAGRFFLSTGKAMHAVSAGDREMVSCPMHEGLPAAMSAENAATKGKFPEGRKPDIQVTGRRQTQKTGISPTRPETVRLTIDRYGNTVAGLGTATGICV